MPLKATHRLSGCNNHAAAAVSWCAVVKEVPAGVWPKELLLLVIGWFLFYPEAEVHITQEREKVHEGGASRYREDMPKPPKAAGCAAARQAMSGIS